MKDLTAYLKKNIPELENNLIKNALELLKKKFLVSCGCGGVFSGVVSGALINNFCESIIPLFIPGGVVFTVASIIASIISIGSYFVSFFVKYTLKCKKIQQIRKQNIETSIHFLWNKIKDDQKLINTFPNDTNNKKILSKIKGCELIIVLENGQSNFMKFIIQCMTGIICNYEEQIQNTKETILFGPFEPQFLLNRISRCYPIFETAINKKICILYLRNYNESDLIKLKPIQEKAMLFLSSNKSIGSYPSIVYKQFCMFFFVQNHEINLLRKEDCIKIQEQLDKSIDKKGYNITFLPILMKDHNCFDNIGPQTNKNLRWAFHHIFKIKDEIIINP